MEVYKEEKEVKRCIYHSEKEVNEQFRRKMNQCRWEKEFRKEVSKVKGGKVGSCSTIKDGNGRLGLGEVEV